VPTTFQNDCGLSMCSTVKWKTFRCLDVLFQVELVGWHAGYFPTHRTSSKRSFRFSGQNLDKNNNIKDSMGDLLGAPYKYTEKRELMDFGEVFQHVQLGLSSLIHFSSLYTRKLKACCDRFERT